MILFKGMSENGRMIRAEIWYGADDAPGIIDVDVTIPSSELTRDAEHKEKAEFTRDVDEALLQEDEGIEEIEQQQVDASNIGDADVEENDNKAATNDKDDATNDVDLDYNKHDDDEFEEYVNAVAIEPEETTSLNNDDCEIEQRNSAVNEIDDNEKSDAVLLNESRRVSQNHATTTNTTTSEIIENIDVHEIENKNVFETRRIREAIKDTGGVILRLRESIGRAAPSEIRLRRLMDGFNFGDKWEFTLNGVVFRYRFDCTPVNVLGIVRRVRKRCSFILRNLSRVSRAVVRKRRHSNASLSNHPFTKNERSRRDLDEVQSEMKQEDSQSSIENAWNSKEEDALAKILNARKKAKHSSVWSDVEKDNTVLPKTFDKERIVRRAAILLHRAPSYEKK